MASPTVTPSRRPASGLRLIAELKKWVKNAGWETLLNRRGTTWRKLDDRTKDSINEASAIKLMLAQPSIIKRPVLVAGKTLLVGFDDMEYKKLKS